MTSSAKWLVLALASWWFVCSAAAEDSALRSTNASDPAIAAVTSQLKALAALPAEEWRFHEGDLPHGEATDLDDGQWSIVRRGSQAPEVSVWYRRWIEVGATLDGYDLSGSRIWFHFSASGNGPIPEIIYFNGRRVAMGEDLEPILLLDPVRPGDRVLVAVKLLQTVDKKQFDGANLRVDFASTRPSPGDLLDEIESAWVFAGSDSGSPNVREAVEKAARAVDLDALHHAQQQTFDASLAKAHALLLQSKPTLPDASVILSGNAHIDAAWLWPWTETVDVVRRTFGTALQLMSEYPHYTFTQSAAAYNEWMCEKYPSLHQQIVERVHENRWEMVGGMWVEPDLNLPDGESLVRQLLVGKRYFREKFGVDVRIGWNPDSFGYNWQLPQIYKKSGVDYFVTQKMEWNDTNKPTKKLFWWQSPDGSRVLTYFPHDYVNQIDPLRMADDFADARKKVPGLDEMMHLYGIGDHGGGPTRWMLDNARKWESPSVVYPHFALGTAQQFFDDMEKKAPSLNLPTWNRELYFEFHRGVFTSQAETKKRNRQSEELLLNAEKFSSLAFLAGDAYPSAALLHDWKKVLFNQFHDIAAGSGIAVVYKDAARDYEEVRNSGNAMLHRALGTLATYADTSGSGAALIVFNPLGWERNDVVETEVQMPGPARVKFVRVSDATGHVVPVEILANKPDTNVFTIRFLATTVPSLGYKVFHVGTATVAPLNPRLIANAGQLENEFLRVKIDSHSGCITSLVDKISKREAIAPGGCGNLLQAFHDLPKEYDAWNIDADFENQKWDLTKAEEVRLTKHGPLEAVVRVAHKFQSSTFVQDIFVTAGVPYVSVRTKADWHEQHILIKAAFPLNVHNDVATYEIPYGSIERPTTRSNS